ncbi:MAG: DsbA family protein [Solirubrobacterales bacterium]
MSGRARRGPRPVGVIAIGAVVAIAIGVIASLSLDEGDTDPIEISGAGEVQRMLGGIRQLEQRLGRDDAPVTVEVFNDLQCEPCADYQLEVVDPLIEGPVRAGDAKLLFRHFTTSERASTIAALGAVAAGEQGDEWQFIELFFRNQDEAAEHGVTDEFLERVAGAILEFNVEQWQQDFDDPEVQERIDADAELAGQRRLPGEPAVVVTGPEGDRELVGAPSLDEVEAAVDAVG